MPYKIKQYTYNKAKYFGVTVRPSKMKGKKIDVFRNGVKIASVGALGYADYPTYLEMERAGKVRKGMAQSRWKAYHARHRTDRVKKDTPAYWAAVLLW